MTWEGCCIIGWTTCVVTGGGALTDKIGAVNHCAWTTLGAGAGASTIGSGTSARFFGFFFSGFWLFKQHTTARMHTIHTTRATSSRGIQLLPAVVVVVVVTAGAVVVVVMAIISSGFTNALSPPGSCTSHRSSGIIFLKTVPATPPAGTVDLTFA